MNASFAQSIADAQRSIRGAGALFREGLVAESHGCMMNALNGIIDAWARLDAIETVDPVTARERGVEAVSRAGYPLVDRLRRALAGTPLGATSVPDNGGNFDPAWAEVERLARFSARRAMTPRARKMRRLYWAVGASLFLAFVVAFALRAWARPRIQASGVYSAAYPAANAIDGLEATEWLLPDNTPGWVDLTLSSRRTVTRVQVVNAHNLFHVDRAARTVRVTAFSGPDRHVSVEGTFAEITDARSLLDLPLRAEGVTRVRVEVLTYFRSGGGLAEIEIH